MEARISYIVIFKPSHGQKLASHHDTIEVEGTTTIKALVELIRVKSLDYCRLHKYEFERFKIDNIT